MSPKIIVSAPIPFWVYWGRNWVGIGSGGLGTKGLGTRAWGLGLGNIQIQYNSFTYIVDVYSMADVAWFLTDLFDLICQLSWLVFLTKKHYNQVTEHAMLLWSIYKKYHPFGLTLTTPSLV